jgi:hypothetical protein
MKERTTMNRLYGMLTLAGVVIATACGGGGVVTSVSGTKPVSSLTPAEKGSACRDANEYVKATMSKADVARMHCSSELAVTGTCTAQLIELCTQAGQQEAVVPQHDCTSTPDTASCASITVDDYSACVKEQVAAAKAHAAQACMAASDPNLTSGLACSRIRMACPQMVW